MCLTDFAMESKIEIIQINISGEDKPGMTSSLTDILARYDAFILDIGQANIHQSLTLGILFMTTSDKSGAILKELLFKASELGVMIRFTPITEEHYQAWVGRQGKNRYIITLLGRQVTARHIAGVTKAVAEQGLNIDAIKRLTGRMPLEAKAAECPCHLQKYSEPMPTVASTRNIAPIATSTAILHKTALWTK